MSDLPPGQQESGLKAARAARRRLVFARRLAVWTIRLFNVALVTAMVVLVMLIGQRLHAPEWLREAMEERIEDSLGGMGVEFSDVQFVIDKGWHPRLRLLDLTLFDTEGREILRLADVRTSLVMSALVGGRVQPRRIALSGAQATLRRARDGKVELSLGGVVPVGRAANLAELAGALEGALERPALSALTSVEMESLTLRYEDARAGRAWMLDGGAVRMQRQEDGLTLVAALSLLSGRDYASALQVSFQSRPGGKAAEFGISVQDFPAEDIATQSIALSWLGVLRAPISGALRGSIDAAGGLGPVSATLQIGAGVLQPNPAARPVPFEGARSYFTYSPEEQVLRFDELSVSSAWVSGRAEGQAILSGVRDGRLTELEGHFTLSGLRLDPGGELAGPLTLDKAGLDFRMSPDPFRLALDELYLLRDETALRVSGEVAAGDRGWRLGIDGRAEGLTPERVLEFWPLRLAPKPRRWVEMNLSDGRIENADFALRLRPGGKPKIRADFDFSGNTIRFLRTMPPIRGAAGHAQLVDRRFSVTATEGRIEADEGGAVNVAGTSFIIPDIGIRVAAPGEVRMNGSGPVTAVMSLLDRPPLRVLKDTPLPVDLAEGLVRASGTLNLPLKKGAQFDEMTLRASGEVVTARSTVLVPGHVATAPVLSVSVDNREVRLSGAVKIDDVPANVTWRQPIGKGVKKASRLEGDIELSPRLLAAFAVGLPPGSVTGKGRGRLVLDFARGARPRLSLTSDLVGLQLRIPQLGWTKPAATGGNLTLTATLGARTRVDDLALEAAGLRVRGVVANHPGGGLERASLSSVRLGGWLDVKAEIVGRGDKAPEIRVLDGIVDMREATFGAGPGDAASGAGESGPLAVRLSRLRVTDSIALDDFEGQFDTFGGLNGIFSARLNGQVAIEGTVVPKSGRSAVRVLSTDAGAVFRAMGILRQGEGGAFTMTLVPVGGEGSFDGELTVRNTRVRDAPAMAALLNAISVVGLLNELAGQGIPFARVDARFRLDPGTLTLYEASAEGPSIGLSMDGVYDLSRGRMAMRGVISPVYMFNAFGSVLTRRGEGLIGFNYTLRGPSDSPVVEVNPLSGLAPGMFREIFRGAAPTVPDAAEPAKPPAGEGTVSGQGGER